MEQFFLKDTELVSKCGISRKTKGIMNSSVGGFFYPACRQASEIVHTPGERPFFWLSPLSLPVLNSTHQDFLDFWPLHSRLFKEPAFPQMALIGYIAEVQFSLMGSFPARTLCSPYLFLGISQASVHRQLLPRFSPLWIMLL